MSTVSSRTPDGEPIRCPVCGHLFPAIPSQPISDTTCPSCGCLLIVTREEEYWQVIGVLNPTTTAAGLAKPIEPAAAESGEPPAENLLPGQLVRITAGTFTNFSGSVAAIDLERGEAVVEISIFGRVTSVAVPLGDLVRVSQ